MAQTSTTDTQGAGPAPAPSQTASPSRRVSVQDSDLSAMALERRKSLACDVLRSESSSPGKRVSLDRNTGGRRRSYRDSIKSRFKKGRPGSRRMQRWLNGSFLKDEKTEENFWLGADDESLDWNSFFMDRWRSYFGDLLQSTEGVVALWAPFLDVTEEEQAKLLAHLAPAPTVEEAKEKKRKRINKRKRRMQRKKKLAAGGASSKKEGDVTVDVSKQSEAARSTSGLEAPTGPTVLRRMNKKLRHVLLKNATSPVVEEMESIAQNFVDLIRNCVQPCKDESSPSFPDVLGNLGVYQVAFNAQAFDCQLLHLDSDIPDAVEVVEDSPCGEAGTPSIPSVDVDVDRAAPSGLEDDFVVLKRSPSSESDDNDWVLTRQSSQGSDDASDAPPASSPSSPSPMVSPPSDVEVVAGVFDPTKKKTRRKDEVTSGAAHVQQKKRRQQPPLLLVLSFDQSYHRMIAHGVCKYHGLYSKSVTIPETSERVILVRSLSANIRLPDGSLTQTLREWR